LALTVFTKCICSVHGFIILEVLTLLLVVILVVFANPIAIAKDLVIDTAGLSVLGLDAAHILCEMSLSQPL
jgi:hypothetical protein